MTRVKICGIKTEAVALSAAEAGADFIGLVFARSPRQITPGQAKKIAAALKGSNTAIPQVVGVFVNTPAVTVNRIAGFCNLDRVQLSGDETWEYCLELKFPFIRAVRMLRSCPPEQICDNLSYGREILSGRDYSFLLDAFDPVRYGGTGKKLDWQKVNILADKFEIILAGGLSPDNVAEAIKTVRPWGVDVSSGVETVGEKDMNKIKAFIKAVRDADAR